MPFKFTRRNSITPRTFPPICIKHHSLLKIKFSRKQRTLYSVKCTPYRKFSDKGHLVCTRGFAPERGGGRKEGKRRLSKRIVTKCDKHVDRWKALIRRSGISIVIGAHTRCDAMRGEARRNASRVLATCRANCRLYGRAKERSEYRPRVAVDDPAV